jgi:serine/threonine protein kinase
MQLPVGTVLGDNYRLTRLIGTGGMGSIYEAAHTGAGKRVAVKVMSRELVAYPEALARFRREVKVTTALEHPHIVDVVDFGVSPTGEPYLVMEYLEGEDLERRLERDRRLPLVTAVPIVKQVASALAVAHAEGIVHRDLKPGNVFLSRAAADEVFVKVVDFGISKVLKSSATKLTMTRAVFGTPEYMAPEQAAGLVESIDHRSDQWSLACVGWQMLSGQLPFWKPDVQSLLNQVVAGEPNALAPDQAGRIPPEVDKVLRRALSKRREDRFPTINAFARAFEAAAEAPTTAPSPVPARARPTPAARAVERGTPRPSRLRLGPWLVLGAVWLALAAGGWMFRAELSAAVSKRFPTLWPGGSPSARRPHSAGGPTVVPLPSDDDGERHRRHSAPRH